MVCLELQAGGEGGDTAEASAEDTAAGEGASGEGAAPQFQVRPQLHIFKDTAYTYFERG